MEPIKKRNAMRKQTIAPGIGEGAPVMQAPGAPRIAEPVSRASLEREKSVKSHFEELEGRYGTSRFTRSRKDEMKMAEMPDTPITDVYSLQMRAKTRPVGIPLEPLVVAEEQRKREVSIASEGMRAAELDLSLQHDVALGQYHAQLDAYAKQQQAYTDYLDAERERKQRDYEARKYGHDSYESLMQAIHDEKLTKRLNELGSVLTDVQIEAQRAIREQTPQDTYSEILKAQKDRIASIEKSLQTSFNVQTPEAGEYLEYIGGVMSDRPTVTLPAPSETPVKPVSGYQATGAMRGWTVTAYPDLKLSAEGVKPYSEPIPTDPIGQIAYHHKPIVGQFRRDTTVTSPAADIGIAALTLSKTVKGRPSPIALPLTSQLLKEPTRPISATVELPGAIAVGAYEAVKSVPYYIKHPAELGKIPGAVVKGLSQQWDTDPVGLVTQAGVSAFASGPIISGAGKLTRPFKTIAGDGVVGLKSYTSDLSLLMKGKKPKPKPPTAPKVLATEAEFLPKIETPTTYDVSGITPTVQRVRTIGDITRYDVVDTMPGMKGISRIDRPAGYIVSDTIPDTKRITRVDTTPTVKFIDSTVQIKPMSKPAKTRKPFETIDASLEKGVTEIVEGIEDFSVKSKKRIGFTAPKEPGFDIPMSGGRQILLQRSKLVKPTTLKPVKKSEVKVITVPELLGKKQREIMADRAKAKTKVKTLPILDVTAEPLTLSAQKVRTLSTQKVKLLGAIAAPVSAVSVASKRDTRTTLGRISASAIAPISVSSSITSPDLIVRPISVSTPTVTPTTIPDVGVAEVSAPDSIVSPTVDSISIQTPDTIAPQAVRPPTIAITRPKPPKAPRRLEEERKRRRSPWDEWMLHYADAPTGHKGLEGAYLRMPDIKRRGPISIKGIQKITIGKPPKRERSPISLRIPSLQFGKRKKR